MSDIKTVSDKQLGILSRFGYDVNKLSDDECFETLDAIAENGWEPLKGGPKPRYERKAGGNGAKRKPGTPTPKQLAALHKGGYSEDETADLTFEEASALLDELAANNWQRPDDI